jgi:hypothetical protein
MIIQTAGLVRTVAMATVLAAATLVSALRAEAYVQEPKRNPPASAKDQDQSLIGKSAPENNKARKSALSRAQDVSMEKRVVGIAITIGKDSAATGQQVGKALKDALLTQGIPSEFEVNTVPGKGVVIDFQIDGHMHLDPPNHSDGGYNMRAAFGQVYAVAAAFKKKFPDAVVKPIVTSAPQ